MEDASGEGARIEQLVKENELLRAEIAERRRAGELLRRSATVFESTSEGVLITDLAARIVAVNQAFTEVTGYSRAEAIGQTPRILKSGRHDRLFYEAMWASVVETGRWHGEIWNRRKNGAIYPELLDISVVRDEEGGASSYVAVFSDLSEMKESEARFEHLVLHDPLTNLPNRLLLHARVQHSVERARRQGRRLALLIVNLDAFKLVNETLGHTAGDAVLRSVAERLSLCVGPEDTVARLGGDEFALLLEGEEDARNAGLAAERVLGALSVPFDAAGREVFLTASAGIGLFPEDGGEVAALLRSADVALHRAKSTGRGAHGLSSPELARNAKERFALETDLRRALRRQEFLLHFQPQLCLETGAVTGVEALTRWQHPERGLVMPATFVPVAEETGLIDGIGAWALRTACAAGRVLRDAGHTGLRMAVNLSGHEISQQTLLARVVESLEEAGFPASALELEITEGFLMRDPEAAARTVEALKELGVTVAIDDFGTGYSSLAYLKRIPVDKLKIDRSFVSDIPQSRDDEAIARAVVALGHGLSLKVTAEGVETEEQATFLHGLDCDEVQGFLYSHPLPAEELALFLSRRPGSA